jgi:hypothetical protein
MRNRKTLAIIVALGLGLIFSAPFVAHAKKKHESQKGGLPALEDRVDKLFADLAALVLRVTNLEGRVTTLEGKVTVLQGQNQFACVNADGTLGNHSTGVTSIKLTTSGVAGQYEVDFGTKNISACAPVATIGTNSATQPTAAIPMGFISVAGDPGTALDSDGEVDSDAIFVQTADTTAVAADRAFCLYVSCP